ncbi:MAG: phage head closure protein [Comamonadaceae bacterium]|nr:phage head closure protein [Pseudomonadales bacterium]NLZ40280.1 phage head closure protein [Comamonadaceae bacterium]
MTLAAGRLNKRVTLQSPVLDQDTATGALATVWADQAVVWAAIEPISVRDFIAADERQSRVTARIVIRHRSDVDASWRVTHGSKVYQIVGVLADQDSGREFVTLAVGEGVNPGGG